MNSPIRAVLPLTMTYSNSCPVTRPDSDWRKTGSIATASVGAQEECLRNR
jgi:hypothetical protein